MDKIIYRVEIFKGEDKQWYWRIRHTNTQIICVSEGYKELDSVLDVVDNLIEKFNVRTVDKVLISQV